jgi:hypothetical protein
MDTFLQMLSLFFEEMIGRASGPLNFRLVVMPTVAAFLGFRAGLRDARDGEPTFLWGIFTMPTGRAAALRSARKDIGRVFIMALIMDTTYQLIALRTLQVFQVLVVAVVCAIVPYVLVRGPVAFVARRLRRKEAT